MRHIVLLSALALAGCLPDTGQCDPEAAVQLAYDQNGTPAFVGQALMISSCGDGGFCHSPAAIGHDRFGAPAGLDYDVRVASTTGDASTVQAGQLRQAQDRLLADHGRIWEQVSSGAMPPPDLAATGYAPTSEFAVASPDGTSAPLPTLDSPEARETLRNWIACGAPVVERTVPRADGHDNAVGFTVPSCETRCVDLTWSSLYAELIAPGCAGSGCHDAETAAGGLDLLGDPAAVRDRLVGAPAQGLLCRNAGVPLLTPGDPMASLLYLKVAPMDGAVTCGARMPVSGTGLNSQRLCALSAWIECGACTDSSCATCLEEHRAACSVPPGGTTDGTCLEQAACPATFSPPAPPP